MYLYRCKKLQHLLGGVLRCEGGACATTDPVGLVLLERVKKRDGGRALRGWLG